MDNLRLVTMLINRYKSTQMGGGGAEEVEKYCVYS